MPLESLAHFILLPELKLTGRYARKGLQGYLVAKKPGHEEYCPKCATPSRSIYDRRKVRVKDAPIRGQLVVLEITKRRFWCKPCQKPFTEPIQGISKGKRTTARYERHLLWACERFTSLKAVRAEMRCSTSYIYRCLYRQLELKQRTRTYPWPKTVGLDEHRFKRGPHGMEFVSVICDHRNRRIFELVQGRSKVELESALAKIPGRENVSFVTTDLSSTYRSFVKDFFPNAKVVADKFHVVRLMHPTINRMRKDITGDKRTLKIRRYLLMKSQRLDFFALGNPALA